MLDGRLPKGSLNDSVFGVGFPADCRGCGDLTDVGITTMAKLIFGCGYVGIRVARRWLERGMSIAVSCVLISTPFGELDEHRIRGRVAMSQE